MSEENATILACEVWAPISPVGKRGTRWIHYSCCSSTKREARRKMCDGWREGSDLALWKHWRKKGWTIERVTIGATP